MITYCVIFKHLGIWSSLKLIPSQRYIVPASLFISYSPGGDTIPAKSFHRLWPYIKSIQIPIAPYKLSKYGFISYLNKFYLKNKGRHKQGD